MAAIFRPNRILTVAVFRPHRAEPTSTTYTMSAATYTNLTATGVTPRVTVTVAS